MNKAVFLDRDGTIVKDVHYCRDPKDIHLLPYAGCGIRLLNEHGFVVIIITNQSGIARGYFNVATLSRIHQKLRDDLAEFGAQIDAIYYCPHHPDDGCSCRKPKPHLALKATGEWEIDLRQSYVIGDKLMDIQMGRAIGCKGIMVSSDYLEAELAKSDTLPDFIARGLDSAAKWILERGEEGRGQTRDDNLTHTFKN